MEPSLSFFNTAFPSLSYHFADRQTRILSWTEPDCNWDTVDNLESTGRMVGNSLGLDFYANGCVPESFWWAGRNKLRHDQRTPSNTGSAGALKLL